MVVGSRASEIWKMLVDGEQVRSKKSERGGWRKEEKERLTNECEEKATGCEIEKAKSSEQKL